jgi:hypothetical protein
MLRKSYGWKAGLGLGLLGLFLTAPLCSAQDRDRYNDRDWDRGRGVYTRLEPGTVVPVRLNQTIDVERRDNRVYSGTVDQDVRTDSGRIAIPRGSSAELMVRVAPDNDLILDLESVVVNGQRYAVRTDPNRVESQRDNSFVGAIVGALNGGQVRGRAVRVPRDSVVTFRLDRPLYLGITDRGVDRDGYHYHDWYNREDR